MLGSIFSLVSSELLIWIRVKCCVCPVLWGRHHSLCSGIKWHYFSFFLSPTGSDRSDTLTKVFAPHSARSPEMSEVFLQWGTTFYKHLFYGSDKAPCCCAALFSAPEPLHSSILCRYGLKNTSFICLPYSLAWVSCSFFFLHFLLPLFHSLNFSWRFLSLSQAHSMRKGKNFQSVGWQIYQPFSSDGQTQVFL